MGGILSTRIVQPEHPRRDLQQRGNVSLVMYFDALGAFSRYGSFGVMEWMDQDRCAWGAVGSEDSND